jgi:hypothetical protein
MTHPAFLVARSSGMNLQLVDARLTRRISCIFRMKGKTTSDIFQYYYSLSVHLIDIIFKEKRHRHLRELYCIRRCFVKKFCRHRHLSFPSQATSRGGFE